MHFSSRRWLRPLLPAFAVAAVGAAAAAASAAGHHSPVVGHVYINDNTSGANTIGGFDRHKDGSLTPLPGSPFTAGGSGTGAGLASQGALQLSPDGHYLLAVDAGSNQISVLRVERDGGDLTELAGSPSSLPAGAAPAGIVVN